MTTARSWLYWAARAHGRLGERDAAIAGYRQVIADVSNSYYGRQAVHALSALAPGAAQIDRIDARCRRKSMPGPRPPNADVIRHCSRAACTTRPFSKSGRRSSESARRRCSRRRIAYALNRKGELRPAIIRMRRAYPQFMAEGGEATAGTKSVAVIFPIAYWDFISRMPPRKNLDPYLMAALVAQESTFEPT